MLLLSMLLLYVFCGVCVFDWCCCCSLLGACGCWRCVFVVVVLCVRLLSSLLALGCSCGRCWLSLLLTWVVVYARVRGCRCLLGC